ncbi:MAG: PTS sugar transporter subunit IIC/EAL domain-containing protein [Spirulina sp. SIO3F2]|nr:PTS sugar transporter subunit IIC/EAL domain-containing protein [Spirulina sp. SIO3F2]
MSAYSKPNPRFKIKQNWRNYLSLTLTAIRESFISLVPYVIVSSLALLIGQFLESIEFESNLLDINAIKKLSNAPNQYLPLALLISLTFHIARRLKVPPLLSILLSISILFSLDSIISGNQSNALFIYSEPSLLIVAIPIISIGLLKYLTAKLQLNFHGKTHHKIREIHEIAFPFAITYLISIAIHTVTYLLISKPLLPEIELLSIGQDLNYILRTLFGQILWFLGIHGRNFFDTIIGADLYSYTIFENLSYQQFHDLFVVCGGSGSGLSLLISILLFSKSKQSFEIARLSLPFVLFNINEILLFGIPIVLNRVLLTPFLLVPAFNISVAYICLPLISNGVSDASVAWTTPIFLNAYLTFDNSIYIIALQAFLLVCDIAIYRPYVKRFSRLQNPNYHIQKMERHLGLLDSLQAAEGIEFHKEQASIIRANVKLDKIIELLQKNSLTVYYQPKIDIKKNICHQFEALLRLKTPSGHVMGPYFLEDIEKAGLAALIDLWVCQTVSQDLNNWKKYGFSPEISINLHPDTLGNGNTLQKIVMALMNQRIEFEIIERSLIEFSDCKSGVLYLREQGFTIALDDFGAGYSNLLTLSELPIHTVKLDRSIITRIDQPSGYKVVKHVNALCTDLKFQCVAEGVETEQQLQILKKMGLQYCQGYYFAQAMPPEETLRYSELQ